MSSWCNHCQGKTETKEGDCEVCGFSKTSENLELPENEAGKVGIDEQFDR